jgi:hypothetical protein
LLRLGRRVRDVDAIPVDEPLEVGQDLARSLGQRRDIGDGAMLVAQHPGAVRHQQDDGERDDQRAPEDVSQHGSPRIWSAA